MSFRVGRRREAPRLLPPVASPAVGSLVQARCGKCKKVTSHVLVRRLAAKPTWVECSVCATAHAFRSPSDFARDRARRMGSGPATVVASAEEQWKSTMARARGPALVYSTRDRYPVGQRLSHPSFGEGVVTRWASTTVCAVIFPDGEKKLLMGS